MGKGKAQLLPHQGGFLGEAVSRAVDGAHRASRDESITDLKVVLSAEFTVAASASYTVYHKFGFIPAGWIVVSPRTVGSSFVRQKDVDKEKLVVQNDGLADFTGKILVFA